MKIIVCIAKEEPHIAEWAAYHLALGFDRIVIYANDWVPFVSDPRVTVIPWPGRAQQFNCYNHALRTQTFDWAAFIDCDEYICCPEGLHSFLHARAESVAMPWRIHGNLESPGGSVIERFRHWDYDTMGHVKVIVKHSPDVRAAWFDNPHFIRGLVTRTPEGCPQRGPFTKEKPGRLFIKHFYYQDEAYWWLKIARGRADNGTHRKENWSDGEKFNTYYDKETV